MIDSLKIFDLLKVHLPEPQARTVTNAIQHADAEIRHDFKVDMAAILSPYATKADLAEMKAEMIRWMFIFWVGQVAAMVAVLKLMK